MQVHCIKCNKHGSLSINQYKAHGRIYKYYGIQHYDPTTKKRRWCYLRKYESLPDQYKRVIHKKQGLSTKSTQTQKKRKSRVFVEKAWCGGWDSNPRTPVGQGPKPTHDLLHNFKAFCMIDLGLADLTVLGHEQTLMRFLRFTGKPVNKTTIQDIRSYLMHYRTKSVRTYRNQLCSLKVFFRDFLKRGDLVESFKFPSIPLTVQTPVPTKQELQTFHDALPSLTEKTVFLLLASSGLRISEGLGLQTGNINFTTRLIIPNSHRGGTKKSWLTFYNTECEDTLHEYMESCDKSSYHLFHVTNRRIQETFKQTSDMTNIHVTAQSLRRWFCSEMLRLGVQEIYIDAFCGRTPKSVLARHYTDYSPKRLKKIYDKADLKVIS